MRLTFLGNRLTLAAAVAWVALAGCQRLPYIDQSKAVPHDPQRSLQEEDDQVQKTSFLDRAEVQLPHIDKPRTPSNPEAQEIWELSLMDAIRIALDNSEIVRVISLGAQGIPVGGFEPTPLNTGAGSALGSGTLATVYDPALQETQIAQALSRFDANLTTQLLWGHNTAPFNNSISAGTFVAGARYPVIFAQQTAQYSATLQKILANGATVSVAHNINWLYSNSPLNVFPSAYTTNTQLQFTQPLLGGTAQNPSGLEANRAPIVIARLNADAAVWRFKSEMMNLVRSVEQQYWALSQQQIQLWAREMAVTLGEEVVRKEEAKFETGSGKLQDLAEAKEQLERFRLDLVTATADVITTERQLRNVLGMKPADNRRIIPVTAPTEARLVPDWDVCLGQMASFHPDIVTYQLFVRLAELQLLIARNQLLPVLNFNALYQFNGLGHDLDKAEAVMTGSLIKAINPLVANANRAAGINGSAPGLYRDFQTWQVGFTFQMPLGFRGPLANARNAQYALLRQRAFLQQVVHQTTHQLNRFFLEVDSNYILFKTAGRLRAAAAQRLEAQQARYEVGELTIDRYLDAVSRWATAVAAEAQFKTSYNTSICALEAAKGTLLAYDNIALAEGPWPEKAYVQARDQRAGHRRLPIPPDGPYHPRPFAAPAVPDPVVPAPTPGAPPTSPLPLLPAPVGPLNPPPTPAAPHVPAGEIDVLSQSEGLPKLPEAEAEVVPASASSEPPPEAPPDLPRLPQE